MLHGKVQWYLLSQANLFEFDTVDGVVTNECGYLSKVNIFDYKDSLSYKTMASNFQPSRNENKWM